ncbi:dUTP diphosphatase [Gemmatimonadota bacterium]
MNQGDHTVVFEPLHSDVVKPSRETHGSAGYDVRAYLNGRNVRVRVAGSGELCEVPAKEGKLTLDPGDVGLIPTGFKARVPVGFEAQVRIRSSMAFKRGLILPNAPGTIDSDYPDEWLIMMKNTSTQPVVIEHGERVAQVILSRVESVPWVEGPVVVTTDRKGGFGSTGHV